MSYDVTDRLGPAAHAADLLTRRALSTPDRVAVIDESGAEPERVTFRELNARANQAAHLLRERFGVGQGERVAILSHNTIAYLDLFFAVGKIGAVLCPLNWRLSPDELSYIVGDAEPALLFVGPECLELGRQLLARRPVPQVVTLDGAQMAGAPSYDLALASQPEEEPRRGVLDADSAYCILYTSGTTGRPKGAVIPHRQVLWNCIHVATNWGVDEADRTPVFLPMFHAGGLLALMPPLLFLGGSITLHRGFEAAGVLRAIALHRATIILAVPTVYQMLLDAPEFESTDLSHVKFFITGGAPCPRPLMEAFRARKPGSVFRQGYGLSEVGPNCFTMTNTEAGDKIGSIGRPIRPGSVRVVGEDGQEVGPGEPGELLLRGPHVCSGYFRNPQATADAIVDGWFHTGDVVRSDADGFFYVAGRKKEMLISGGENIYCAEVEAVFDDHPAVVKSALIGRPDDRWGEVGVIVVHTRAGVEAGALLAHARTRLARYKLPRLVVFTDDMPYTAYGKVRKPELCARYGQPLSPSEPPPPAPSAAGSSVHRAPAMAAHNESEVL